jgi:hypothetical protein
MSITHIPHPKFTEFIAALGNEKLDKTAIEIVNNAITGSECKHSMESIEDTIKDVQKIERCLFVLPLILSLIMRQKLDLSGSDIYVIVRLAVRFNNPDLLYPVDPFQLDRSRSLMFIDVLSKAPQGHPLMNIFIKRLRDTPSTTVWNVPVQELSEIFHLIDRLADIFKLIVVTQHLKELNYLLFMCRHKRFTTLDAEIFTSAVNGNVPLPQCIQETLLLYIKKCLFVNLTQLINAYIVYDKRLVSGKHHPKEIACFEILPGTTVVDEDGKTETFQASIYRGTYFDVKNRIHRKDAVSLGNCRSESLRYMGILEIFVTVERLNNSIITGMTFVEGEIKHIPKIDTNGHVHVMLANAMSALND